MPFRSFLPWAQLGRRVRRRGSCRLGLLRILGEVGLEGKVLVKSSQSLSWFDPDTGAQERSVCRRHCLEGGWVCPEAGWRNRADLGEETGKGVRGGETRRSA